MKMMSPCHAAPLRNKGRNRFCCTTCGRYLRKSKRRPSRVGCMMKPDARGYKRIYLGKGHPYANSAGWQYLHRYLVMCDLGRRLRSDEHVHHVNGLTGDCRNANLQVVVAEYHGRYHAWLIDLAGWRDDEGRFTEHGLWPPRATARFAAVIGPAARSAA